MLVRVCMYRRMLKRLLVGGLASYEEEACSHKSQPLTVSDSVGECRMCLCELTVSLPLSPTVERRKEREKRNRKKRGEKRDPRPSRRGFGKPKEKGGYYRLYISYMYIEKEDCSLYGLVTYVHTYFGGFSKPNARPLLPSRGLP